MILILGKNGQLARALAEQNWGEECVVAGSSEIDFSDTATLREKLHPLITQKPRLVFNAAAYTAVDRAETEQDKASAINTQAVGILGEVCALANVPLVHFSTDYVYPGTGNTPWRETEPTNPQNFYGLTKLRGEEAILNSKAQSYIFRISWVVSCYGNNFVKTLLRLGAERETLKIVNDQIGSPMSAHQIAGLMHRCFHQNKAWPKTGIYNLSSSPFVSWKEFAQTIFESAGTLGFPLKVTTVEGIPTSEYPTPAARPMNSRMDDAQFSSEFQDRLGSWKDGLQEILRRLQ